MTEIPTDTVSPGLIVLRETSMNKLEIVCCAKDNGKAIINNISAVIEVVIAKFLTCHEKMLLGI
jgi:hypothetical protein